MPLNLFDYVEGGRQGVLDKFISLFKPVVKTMSDDDKRSLIESYEWPQDVFDRIESGDTSVLVGNNVINGMCNSFAITVDEGFERINLGDVDWQKELRLQQIVMTAPLSAESQAKLHIILGCLQELEA